MKKTLSAILALILLMTSLLSLGAALAEEEVVFSIAVSAAEIPDETSELYWFTKYITDTYPNAKIEWQMNSTHDDHRTKIKLQAQANEMPDMFWESMENVPELIEMGALAPITEAVKDVNFVAGATDNVTFDGEVYGMVYKNDIMGFWYNKDLLASVGYDAVPTDWNEFLNMIVALKEAGITPISHGGTDLWAVWGYNLFFHRYGFDQYKDAFLNGEIKWAETEALVKPFERICELAAAGAYPETVTTQGNDYAMNVFLAGDAALYSTGTWAIFNFNQSEIVDSIELSWGPLFEDGIEDQKIALKEYTNAYWFSKAALENETKRAILFDAIRNWYSQDVTNDIVVDTLQLMPAVPYTGTGEKISALLTRCLGYVADDYSANIQVCVGIPDSSFQQPFWNAITSCITGFMTAEEAAASMDEWFETR